MTLVDSTTPQHSTNHRLNFPEKKILLVTIFGRNAYNLGNALQHYALQETLHKCGFEVNSISCPLRNLPALSFSDKVTGFLDSSIRKAAKLLLGLIGIKKYRSILIKKIKTQRN